MDAHGSRGNAKEATYGLGRVAFERMLHDFPFARGEDALRRRIPGTGLGLAIVKNLAELHGGSVRAKSAGEGKGSEFVVRLPLTDAGPSTATRPRPSRPGRSPTTRSG